MADAKRRIDVGGPTMAVVERGAGDPIVFLHGNPTSSFVWRNIIPHVEHLGRCLAPDLVGFGDSDKLPRVGRDSGRFVEHRTYLDRCLDALDVAERVILVLHDWGSGLGFDWARRHADRVAGIAYFESIVAPRSWDQLGDDGRAFFRRVRSDEGESMVLEDNAFIERGLPGGVIRDLSDAEMAEYRRPFVEPGEGRRGMLTLPREIPFDGAPADVHALVAEYSAWLAGSSVPKLLIDVSDGDTLTGSLLEFARSFPNQTEASVTGRHFAQEDSSDEIGRALADWIATLER